MAQKGNIVNADKSEFWVDLKYEFLGAPLDGIEKNAIIEVKCLYLQVFSMALKNAHFLERRHHNYYYQVTKNLTTKNLCIS